MAFFISSPLQQSQISQTLTLTPTPAQQPQSFFTPNSQFASFPHPQSQPPTHQHQMYLFTTDRSPAGYNTKFEDLHPDSQKFLLQIEERIMEYKDESQRLEQNSRLYGSSMSSDTFELDASHILQELRGISTAMDKEKFIVQELMGEVKNLIWNTEVAVRSYMIIRPRFHRQNASNISDGAPTSNVLGQPSSSMAPQYDFYSGFPKRPSPFLQFSLARFDKYITECRQWVEELEQLLLVDSEKTPLSSGPSSLQSLPNIMSNVHDFFVHVAAKVESLHQYIESMKTAFLADQRRHGDSNDPFLEADRRETAKMEAAARRVHPTLHLPAVSAQPSTQGAGFYSSSVAPISSSQLQTVGSSGPVGGFSLFGTSSSGMAVATSSLLFSTPTTSAPSSGLFGSTGFSFQPSSSGTPSPSVFGASQTPSFFGASTPSFSSSPAIGSSTLFATPTLTLGTATGSGASFGAASKSARPKSRTARR